jgi:hypothetical protein
MFLSTLHKMKSKLLTIALGTVLVLCSIDHVGPMAGTTDHSDTASHGCLKNFCVTLTSKDVSSSDKSVWFLLLQSLMSVSWLSHGFIGKDRASRYFLIKEDHPPKSSIKLYQLHAAYLI